MDKSALELMSGFRRAPAHLRLLVVMRAAAIAAIAAVFFCFDCFLEIHVPLATVAVIIGFYAVVDLATLLRLRDPAPIGEAEMLVQLLGDVAILTALLYLTGGARNPIALYYLLLVLYSSTALPPRLTWLLAGVSVVCYVALHFFHVALPLPEPEVGGQLDHLTGILMYVLVAALIASFGIKLSALQQVQREQRRADAEKDARERYLVSLAALSAGAAHDLSTPLSTISVLVNDLRENDSPPPDWRENIDMLWTQVQLCRRSLSELAGAAGVESLGPLRSVLAGELVAQVAGRLRSLRPALPLELSLRLDDDLALQSDPTLAQALETFLNNAADASPSSVELRATQDALNPLKLVIEVLDRGTGVAPELRRKLGMAQAAIERLGGNVAISERRSGGTCVRIELPGVRPGNATRRKAMR